MSELPPPFTPFLLASPLLPPRAVLQRVVDAVVRRVVARHEAAFARLAVLGDAAIMVLPADLPLGFVLRPGRLPPRVEIVPPEAAPPSLATLRGPFLVLIDLLQGRLDGDAVFFARDLTIEGDAEAVLLLRNVLDGAGIDLARDVLPEALPALLRSPALRGLAGLEALLRRAQDGLDRLAASLAAPAMARIDRQQTVIEGLGARTDRLQRRAPRPQRAEPIE